jgi:hypothetical protein
MLAVRISLQLGFLNLINGGVSVRLCQKRAKKEKKT